MKAFDLRLVYFLKQLFHWFPDEPMTRVISRVIIRHAYLPELNNFPPVDFDLTPTDRHKAYWLQCMWVEAIRYPNPVFASVLAVITTVVETSLCFLANEKVCAPEEKATIKNNVLSFLLHTRESKS